MGEYWDLAQLRGGALSRAPRPPLARRFFRFVFVKDGGVAWARAAPRGRPPRTGQTTLFFYAFKLTHECGRTRTHASAKDLWQVWWAR